MNGIAQSAIHAVRLTATMNRRRIVGGNKEETMADNKQEFVTIDRDYVKELEKKARRVDWLEGYIEGVDDTLNHLVELLQAYKGN